MIFRNLQKDANVPTRLRAFLLWALYVLFLCSVELIAFWRSFVEIGPWTIPFYGIIFGSGFIAFRLMRRSHRRDAVLTSSFLSERTTGSDSVPRCIVDYLSARAMIIASLLTRGASEIYLKNHQIPAGAILITRQSQNESLRRWGLWAALEAAELELVGAADGCWTAEQVSQVSEWCEQLRLLRWVLGVDRSLKPINETSKSDFSLSKGLNKLDRPLSAKQTLQPSDIRPVRDLAREYLDRVSLEVRRRRLLSTEDTGKRGNQEMPSFPVGSRDIAELTDDELNFMLRVLNAHSSYAQYLIDQLSTDTPTPYSAWVATLST